MMMLPLFNLRHPGISSQLHPEGEPSITITKFTFSPNTLFSPGGGSFLALSAAGHAGGSREHHGASVVPGRISWRVLSGFKVVKPGK